MLNSVPESEVPFLPKDHEGLSTMQHVYPYGRASKRLIAIVASVSALVSVIATVIVHSFFTSLSIRAPVHQELFPLLDLAPLGNVLRTYIPEPDYVKTNLNESHEAWMKLFPQGMGYVSMDKIKAAGDVPQLFEDMSTDGSGRFCVAAFHQLHCLYLIYADFRRLQHGEITQVDMHTLHCFDYLRESLICAADSALEPFRSPFDGGTGGDGIDGFGSVHQCRNFEQLFVWSERFRYTDDLDAERFEG